MSLNCFAISLGCPKNRVDTERALGSLGVNIALLEEVEGADLVFINTCGFIAPAISESIEVIVQAIDDANEAKNRPFLVVAGCLVGRFGIKQLAPDLPEVDLWLDKQDNEAWPLHLQKALGLPNIQNHGRFLSTGPSYAWLKIGDGCENHCSFCTIPSICGKNQSHSADFLEQEARRLLNQGVKELVLVGQDLTAWGRDFAKDVRLPHLLDKIAKLKGLERLRLLYLYPSGLTKEFLSYLSDMQEVFVPYFDVPLQHSHPEILRKMGRPFAGNPREVIDRIRHSFPNAALRTSFIVGFPGEKEEHFTDLTNFIEETAFQHLGVFSYAAEDGTAAAKMPEQIEEAVKEERKDILMEMQADISAELLEAFVGTEQTLLVDAVHPEWPTLYIARTWFQAPEIDGISYLSGENIEVGKMVKADITESKEYDLIALA